MRTLGLLALFLAVSLCAVSCCHAFAQTTVTVTAEPQSPATNPNASPSPTELRTESLHDFIMELQSLSDALDEDPADSDLAKMRSSLPKFWSIHTDTRDFLVSSAPLDQALAAPTSEAAQDWIDHVLYEARGYETPVDVRNLNARQQLDHILASNEFAAVHPPSAWDLFRERLSAWLNRMLNKLFGGLERYPIAGEILFWAILILAVSFLARFLFRFFVSRDRLEALADQEIVSATRTWQEWIRLAKDAAARQDYREAVHSAYWAGVARLEDLALLPKDRTKTPREYLRLLSQVSQHELAARPVAYGEPLRDLNTRLERTWYANRGARPEDFSESLRQLKALGCQLE
jgi:hypothetical protein